MSANKNKQGDVIETTGTIELNTAYWDCSCLEYYIHSINKTECLECGDGRDDSPNAREIEVQTFIYGFKTTI